MVQTDTDKAKELSLNFIPIADDIEDHDVVDAMVAMAEWKDEQFYAFLREERDEACKCEDTITERVIDELINRFNYKNNGKKQDRL